MKLFTIITGNPVDGLTFVGPFADDQTAQEYGDRWCAGDWWVADLEDPTEYTHE